MLTARVITCLEIFEVMKRADCKYVPSGVVKRVYPEGSSLGSIMETLHWLRRNGVVESKKGSHGGFKHVRPVSLLELVQIFSPTHAPEPDKELYSKQVNKTLAKLKKTLSECIIIPEKLVPLDYCLDDDNVDTASTDAHGPMDGHL